MTEVYVNIWKSNKTGKCFVEGDCASSLDEAKELRNSYAAWYGRLELKYHHTIVTDSRQHARVLCIGNDKPSTAKKSLVNAIINILRGSYA